MAPCMSQSGMGLVQVMEQVQPMTWELSRTPLFCLGSTGRLKGAAVDVSMLKSSLSAKNRCNLQEKTEMCSRVPVKVFWFPFLKSASFCLWSLC